MRQSRIKPLEGWGSFVHLYNRVVGTCLDYPFHDAEKEHFLRILQRLSRFYTIEPIAYQVMGNHYHLLVYVPAHPPSRPEAACRYESFYSGKRHMNPESEACEQLRHKLRDISAFVKDLQQPFTRWFNRTRPIRRRGHLWAERFKNTLLQDGWAVWSCWKYIEMNSVRAHMATTPADYRFCSFGAWCGQGKHPFGRTVQEHLLPWLSSALGLKDLSAVRYQMTEEFGRLIEEESGCMPLRTPVRPASGREPFSLALTRRVRYWVDGVAIGSDLFVRAVVAQARPRMQILRRRLTRVVESPLKSKVELYSFRRLRILTA